jgi:hypothetical protein
MFYKLINETTIKKAPKPLKIDGKDVFGNSEKLHNDNGYYKLEQIPYPQDGNSYEPIYRLDGNLIVQNWKIAETPLLPYKDRVIARIRERYTIDDEIAILRQKDTKFEEWVEYNSFVENVKIEEKVKEQIF